MSTQILKKKRIKDPVCSYLRKLISPYGFGWARSQVASDRYSNEQLIRWYNTSGFMGTPTNSDLYAHFAGQDTLYFWADGRKSSPLTLSMIDIDCHESGNPQSAKAFADWLNQTITSPTSITSLQPTGKADTATSSCSRTGSVTLLSATS